MQTLKWLALRLSLAAALFFGSLLGLRQYFFRGPILPPEPFTEKVMDLHVHAAGLGEGKSGCYVSKEIRESFKITEYLKAFGLTKAELKRGGDKLSIARIAQWVRSSKRVKSAVILAIDGFVDEKGKLDLKHTEMYIPNEFVAKEVKKYPELRWGASINPYRPNALELLEKAKADGAVLIKWIPPIQGFDPADPKLTAFYAKLRNLDLPLLTHTGQERAFTYSDDRLADPTHLKLALNLGVTVIAAHAATTGETDGEDNLERLLAMLPVYPTLYADISSLTQLNKLGYLRKLLLDKRSKGKLLYGSDFPLTNTKLVSAYFFPLDLTWAEMRRVEAIPNPFDRDVALKEALGVPREVFLHPLGK